MIDGLHILLFGLLVTSLFVAGWEWKYKRHERAISNQFGEDILLAYSALKAIANIVDRGIASSDPWYFYHQAGLIKSLTREGQKINIHKGVTITEDTGELLSRFRQRTNS